MPVSAVLAALAGVGERNAAFHAADQCWRRAGEDQNRRAAERDGGREALPLLEPVVELNWQPGDPPSDLLRPRYGVVPFVARGELLGQVMRWREADERMRVLVLTGAGGLGKTRTAIEVCGQAERSGWTSGLLGAADRTGSADGLGELAGWRAGRGGWWWPWTTPRRGPSWSATCCGGCTGSAAELLAATRLDAGLHPDSAEAHLRHALAALDQGLLDEADRAIHRCADCLASWERPTIHRRLTALADARPDLDVSRIIQAFNSALNQRDQPDDSTET